MIQSCVTPTAQAQEASYCASLRRAKAGQPHRIRQQLPIAKEMAHIMCGEKAAKKFNLVPQHRVTDDDHGT